MRSYDYTIFADYFQFYLQDEEVEGNLSDARIYYGDLDALSEDGLDGDDHYRIALWKSEPKGVRVVKRRGE